MMAKRDDNTFDLLSWEPPQLAPQVPDELVRAGTLRGRISRAVALVLRESTLSREEIAHRMTEFLGGKTVSVAMLDAYASQARDEHTISAVRLAALCYATGDSRALQVLADVIGLAVVPTQYVPAIEDAMIDDQIERLTQRKKLKRAQWRGTK